MPGGLGKNDENLRSSKNSNLHLLDSPSLEAVCQRIHKPNLCVQKDSIIRLKLF